MFFLLRYIYGFLFDFHCLSFLQIIESNRFWEHIGHHHSYRKNTLITSSFIVGTCSSLFGPFNHIIIFGIVLVPLLLFGDNM